jgi:hypothetical protein
MFVRFSKKYGYEIEVALQENGNIVKLMPEYVEINYRYGVVDIRNGWSRTIVPLARIIYVRATKVPLVKRIQQKAGGGNNASTKAPQSNQNNNQ